MKKIEAWLLLCRVWLWGGVVVIIEGTSVFI